MQSIQSRWPLMRRATRSSGSSTRAAAPPPRVAAPRAAVAVVLSVGARPASPRCRAAPDGGGDAPAAAPTTATATALSTADFDEGAPAPPGCARYKVSLSKPLGLVFEQDLKTLVVRVASLSAEGAAEKANVGVGDQLIAVSGIVYDRIEEYGEVKVSKGQSRIRLAARGETMKTLGAAISSHPGNWTVDLEFQRCETGGGAGGVGGGAAE